MTPAHRRVSPFVFIVLASAFVFVPFAAGAATVGIRGPADAVVIGSSIVVDVLMDTGVDAVNAVEGTLQYSRELFEFDGVRDGSSILTFWIERAHVDGDRIRFSGMTPGGFTGVGRLFSVTFRARTAGEGVIALASVQVLRHDGVGSPVPVDLVPLPVRVTAGAVILSTPVPEDHDPPEPFTPVVSQTDEAFDGKAFLSFDAQDKGGGIAYYEVSEGKDAFRRVESPTVLEHQRLDGVIVVRAVDRAGNIRTAEIPPVHPPKGRGAYLLLVLLATLVVLVVIAPRLWQIYARRRAGN